MTCAPLAATGLEAGQLVLLALALLVAGMLVRRSRRVTGAAVMLALLVVGGGTVVGPATPAQAAASDCVTTADNSLTVTQTSVMEGLAPGVAPADITGLIVNNGPDGTRIAAVDVVIVAVQPGGPGTCDASDYLLLDARMPVAQQSIAPGGSTTFAGAAIGFRDKAIDQNACQNATILLRYTVVAG